MKGTKWDPYHSILKRMQRSNERIFTVLIEDTDQYFGILVNFTPEAPKTTGIEG